MPWFYDEQLRFWWSRVWVVCWDRSRGLQCWSEAVRWLWRRNGAGRHWEDFEGILCKYCSKDVMSFLLPLIILEPSIVSNVSFYFSFWNIQNSCFDPSSVYFFFQAKNSCFLSADGHLTLWQLLHLVVMVTSKIDDDRRESVKSSDMQRVRQIAKHHGKEMETGKLMFSRGWGCH